MNKYDYDVMVIGGGAAGLSAAKTAAGFGKKTVLIEKNRTGGECTWTGCIPSKTLIKNARIVHDAVSYKKAGKLRGNISANSSNIMKAVREVIRTVYKEEDPETLKKTGVDVISADAHLLDKNRVSAGKRIISASKIIIATGSSPSIPPVTGLTKSNCLTNENIFDIKKIPSSIIILGGGPIGTELAQALSRLGSRVTIVEMGSRILFREEPELTFILKKKLIDEGIKIYTDVKAVQYRKKNKKAELSVILENGTDYLLSAESLFCAAGRKPNIENMGLEKAGVTFNFHGIQTDDYMRTNIKNIYACGDVTGPYQFSHVAGKQGVTAALNAILPLKTKMDYSTILWTTYTDPELSRIGLTEEEAMIRYRNIRIVRVPYNSIDRAVTEKKTDGLAKFVLDKNNIILGAHILGESAGEIIHEIALLKKTGKPLTLARSYMHAYPSYSDIIAKGAHKAYLDKLFANPVIKFIKFIKNRRK